MNGKGSRRQIVSISVLAITAALLIGICTSCTRREAPDEPVVSVQAVKVVREPIERVVAAEGILYPLEQAAITPKVTAPVEKFYVRRGSRVHKGQLLARLENRSLAAAVIENKGAYEEAQARYTSTVHAALPQELEQAKLNLQGDKEALQAEKKLYRSRKNLYEQGALPRKELDQARVSLTQARNRYKLARQRLSTLQKVGKREQFKAAQGQLASAEGRYLGAQAQLGYTEIRSPIDGVVTERPFYSGETPPPGTPILTIMNTAKVIARAHLPQEQAELLKQGDPAVISAPGIGNVAARVSLVSPAVDPNSTTIQIWVEATNPKARLRPGMAVQLRIVAAKVPDALVVPSSALLTSDSSTSVMVVGSDGHAHQRTVVEGIRQGDRVQIQKGVSPGELVVSSGAYGLPDGTRVAVSASAAPSPTHIGPPEARP